MTNQSFFSQTLKYLFPLLILVTPLLVLPLTPNYFNPAKQLLITLSLAAVLFAWAFNLLAKKELTLARSVLNVPLLLFVATIILNILVFREGRLESVVGRGALYIAAALLAYFASLLSGLRQVLKGTIHALIGVGSLLAVHSLLHLTILYRLETLPGFMASRAFTPTGSPLTTLVLLIIGAGVTFFYAAQSLKGRPQYLAFFLGTVQTIAAVAYLSLMLPGSELAPNLLPYLAAWSVTLDALKTPKSFFLGVGLPNFPLLFTTVKPLFLNSGPFWNAYPVTAPSELLQLLSTSGLLGLLTFLALPAVILLRKPTLRGEYGALFLALLLSLVSLVLAPGTIPLLLLFFLILGLLSGGEKVTAVPNRFSSFLAAGFIISAAVTLSYYALRVYLAENHLFRAGKALAAQDGRTVYREHLAAIKLLPAMASYRLAYSQVNLSLASALSQKADLSDQEREQVSSLVSQAIREVKLAAGLRPHDARIWQNMGSLYRNLINVAEGADQFAISAYAKAVALDPGSPALRVEYGGLLYQLSGLAKEKDIKNTLLSRAISEFQTAVQLKSDYANGYYNLSRALESAGNIQGAYTAMQKTVASLDPASPDLGKATAEMESLKGKLPQASPSPTPSSAGEISTPSPLPSPLPGGPLDVGDSPIPTPTP